MHGDGMLHEQLQRLSAVSTTQLCSMLHCAQRNQPLKLATTAVAGVGAGLQIDVAGLFGAIPAGAPKAYGLPGAVMNEHLQVREHFTLSAAPAMRGWMHACMKGHSLRMHDMRLARHAHA